MLILSLLASVLLQSKPKFVAVQLWDKYKPVRAWTPDGKPLPKTISIPRSDYGFPSVPGEKEIIAVVPCELAENAPSAQWTAVRGLRRTIESSSWKDDDPNSKLWAFSLLGTPDAKEVAGVVNIASGPMRIVAGTKTLRLNTWTNLGKGFRARIRNRYILEEESGERAVHAFFEVILPPQFRNWDVWESVTSSDTQLGAVTSEESGRARIFKLERGAPRVVAVTISARPYVPYVFDHIHLKPH